MIDGCEGDARLAGLTLRNALQDAQIVEVVDPVALGRQLVASQWDLAVVADLRPWGDAPRVLQSVRDAQPGIPAILLGAELATAEALRAGFADALPKTSEGFLQLPEAVGGVLERLAEGRQRARLETRLQTLLDEAGVGFFRATLGGRLLEVNSHLLRLLGVEDLPSIQDLELPSPYFRRQSRDALLRHLDERGALHASELELPHGAAGRRWVSLTERLCLDTEGDLVVDGLVVDLTERKRAEREIEERAHALDRSNQDLQRFAYVASHELQAPLRQVAKYSELLAADAADRLGDDGMESLGFVRDGIERMQRLIDDLLAFSRVESRAGEVRLVALADVVEEALADLDDAIAESHAEIEVGELPEVAADPSQLRLLFDNLVGNAIKFRAEARPRVAIAAERTAEGWVIAVEDNGIGIDKARRDEVFEVFRRLHAEFPGSGIGLAISKKIVERHGGRIWVEPAEAGGSIFRFLLPAQSAPSQAIPAAVPDEEARG